MKSKDEIENEAFPIKSLENCDKSESFKDNFVATQVIEPNANGLMMPDSSKYLHTLEQKLDKLKNTSQKPRQTNSALVKEMLRSLAEKRDEAFLKEAGNLFSDIDYDKDDSIISSLQNMITDNKLGQMIMPQLHSTDKEELFRLLKHDVLDQNKETSELNETQDKQ